MQDKEAIIQDTVYMLELMNDILLADNEERKQELYNKFTEAVNKDLKELGI